MLSLDLLTGGSAAAVITFITPVRRNIKRNLLVVGRKDAGEEIE
jgi:hypothetical protein